MLYVLCEKCEEFGTAHNGGYPVKVIYQDTEGKKLKWGAMSLVKLPSFGAALGQCQYHRHMGNVTNTMTKTMTRQRQ